MATQKDKIMTLEDIEQIIREGTKGRDIDFGDIAVACGLSIEMIFKEFDEAINDFIKKKDYDDADIINVIFTDFLNKYIVPIKKKYKVD